LRNISNIMVLLDPNIWILLIINSNP
jgi:hypothetical protein